MAKNIKTDLADALAILPRTAATRRWVGVELEGLYALSWPKFEELAFEHCGLDSLPHQRLSFMKSAEVTIRVSDDAAKVVVLAPDGRKHVLRFSRAECASLIVAYRAGIN